HIRIKPRRVTCGPQERMSLTNLKRRAADHRVLAWTEQFEVIPRLRDLDTNQIRAVAAAGAEPCPFGIRERRFGVYEQLSWRGDMQPLVLADHHLDKGFGGRLVEVELFRVGLKPGAKRPTKHHALSVRQKHLRRATGVTLIARQFATFVDKPDVANAG